MNELVARYFSGFITEIMLGYMIGMCRKDRLSERVYQTVRERGDYWFNKYLEACNEDDESDRA